MEIITNTRVSFTRTLFIVDRIDFLSSIAKNGENGKGLKIGLHLKVWMLCIPKVPNSFNMAWFSHWGTLFIGLFLVHKNYCFYTTDKYYYPSG